jgi:hypothetical protein
LLFDLPSCLSFIRLLCVWVDISDFLGQILYFSKTKIRETFGKNKSLGKRWLIWLFVGEIRQIFDITKLIKKTHGFHMD